MKAWLMFLFLCLYLSCLFQNTSAQPPAWHLPGKMPVGFEPEINAFLRQDSIAYPPPGAWLFTGSSTIRMWDSIASDFDAIPLIHRGFGGSTMKALNYYLDYIVVPYRPANIVVYEGDNDLVSGVSPEEFVSRCDTFIRHVHEKLPKTKIWFISIKPSVARKAQLPQQDEANQLLKKLAGKHWKTGFIDIRPLMYTAEGELRRDLFMPDSLHVTRECYRIWAGYMRRKPGIR